MPAVSAHVAALGPNVDAESRQGVVAGGSSGVLDPPNKKQKEHIYICAWLHFNHFPYRH